MRVFNRKLTDLSQFVEQNVYINMEVHRV